MNLKELLEICPKTKEQNMSYELLVTFSNRFPDVPMYLFVVY